MKISNNMSHRSFLWQLRTWRAFAIFCLTAAVFNQRYFIDLVAFAGIFLIGSIAFSRRQANFRLEVYDCVEFLTLKLDDGKVVVYFSEIEKMKIRDGNDGLDWVTVYLCSDSKFGRIIQFYPNMANIPMGRVDIWLAEINERISKSKINSGR